VEIAGNWLPSVKAAEELNTTTSDFRIAEFRHVTSLTDEAMAAAQKEIDKQAALLATERKIYEPLISSAVEKDLYTSFSSNWDEYIAVHDKVIALSSKNENAKALALLNGEGQKHFDDASRNLLKIVRLNVEGGKQRPAGPPPRTARP
jgi:hypothetical protein